VTHNRSDGRGHPNHGWATIDSFTTGGENTMLLPPPDTLGPTTFNWHRFSRVSNRYIVYQREDTREAYVCDITTGAATHVGVGDAWDFFPGALPALPPREPVIAIDTRALSFMVDSVGGTASDQTVVVTNSGGGVLDSAVVSAGIAWLSVARSVQGQTQLLRNHVSSASLAPGVYHGLVVVRGGSAFNDERYVVTLNVGQHLPAPSGLRLRAVRDNAVELRWFDNAPTASAAAVERATGAGPFGEVARLPAPVARWVDSGLTTDQVYVYRIRATGGSGFSGYSLSESINLTATPAIAILEPRPNQSVVGGDTLHIRWSTERVSNIVISYSIDGGEHWQRIVQDGITPADRQWGNYAWLVPNRASGDCYLELSDYLGTVLVTSAPFSIQASTVRRRVTVAPRALHAPVDVFDCRGRRVSAVRVDAGGMLRGAASAAGLHFVRAQGGGGVTRRGIALRSR
jgi:hypothetical protein